MKRVSDTRGNAKRFDPPAAPKSLDFKNVSSMQEIVLWATVNGIEIDGETAKLFLASTRLYRNMYSVFLSGLKETNLLDGFVNRTEFVEFLFELYEVWSYGVTVASCLFEFEKWLDENGSKEKARRIKYKTYKHL